MTNVYAPSKEDLEKSLALIKKRDEDKAKEKAKL